MDRLRTWKVLGALLVVVVLFVAGVLHLRSARMAAELDDALARAKAQGLATDVDEFVSSLEPHDESALAAWKATEGLDFLASLPKTPASGEDHWLSVFDQMASGDADPHDAQSLLLAADTYLERMRFAASLGTFVPKKKWSDAGSVLLPELAILRSATRALAGAGAHRARIGDVDGSLRDLEASVQVVAVAAVQPGIIGRLVYSAYVAIACKAISTAASYLANDIAALDRLQGIADSIPLPDFKEALGHELAIVRRELALFSEGRSITEDTLDDRLLRRGVSAAEVIVARHIADVAENWDDLAKVRSLAQSIDAIQFNAWLDPAGSLAGMLLFGAESYIVKERTTLAILASARIGVSALRLRARNGEWPTLDEAAGLAGVDATDPFDGNRLRYAASEYELRVYSVSENLRDDGGNTNRNAGEDDYARFVVRLNAALPGDR